MVASPDSYVAAAVPLLAVGAVLPFRYPGGGERFLRTRCLTWRRPLSADYVARLESHLQRQPRDARGWVLLGRAHAQADRFDAAVLAFGQAVAVSPGKVGKDATVLTEYADAMAMSQGGRLSGRPAALIERALELNPKHPTALDMAGSLAYEEGRYADCARYWRDLLGVLPTGSQRRRELTLAIQRAEQRAEASTPR